MSIPDPFLGSQLGDYKIIDLLGRGGMARVYRGYDANLDRYAAVKVIDANPGSVENKEEYRQRFLREARAIARLRHPNIVGVYQFGEHETFYYMAMVFIDGRDLGQILKEGQGLPPKQTLRIIHDIAGALDYAHAGGVIHRDVKPSNIMVTKQGQAILTDFGLALSVPEGTIGNTFGSVHYIAPEQAVSSASAVPQSDLYSLGVVLYQMLTGRVPFDDTSAMSVALMHLNDEPPPMRPFNPAVTPEVENVVRTALAKEPDDRFHNGESLVRALERALGVSTISESHLPPLPILSPEEPVIGKTSSTIVFPPSDPLADEWDLETVEETTQPPAPRQNKTSLWIGAGVILAAAVTIFLWVATQRNGEDTLLTPTSAQVAQLESPTPSQTLQNTQTAQPTRHIEVVSTGRTEEAAVTAAEATASTDTPAPTTAITSTRTRRATRTSTSTLTPTSTTEPTADEVIPTEHSPTDTPEPTASAAEETTPTAESSAGSSFMLVYDEQSFTLINSSDQNIDVSGISFVQTVPGGSQLSFRSDQWTNGTRPTWSLTPGDCFQLWQINQPELPVPDVCNFRHAWRAVAPTRWFWLSHTEAATFEVRRNAEVLAACPVAAGICEVVLEEQP